MRRDQGITIVEILVFVIILSIVLAVVVPALRHSREGARQGACAANLMKLGKGVRMYCEEWGGFTWPRAYPEGSRGMDRAQRLVVSLQQYVPEPNKTWQCPSDRHFGSRAEGTMAFPNSVSYAYQGYYPHNTLDNHKEPWPLSESQDPDYSSTGEARNLDADATDPLYQGQYGWLFSDIRVMESGRWDQPGWTFTAHGRGWAKPNDPYIKGLVTIRLMPDLHARTCKGWQQYPALNAGAHPGSAQPTDYNYNLP